MRVVTDADCRKSLFLRIFVIAVPVAAAALCAVFAQDICALGTLLPQCFLRSRLGLWCPACGNTRAVQHLLSGDIIASLQYHACGAYNRCRLILDGAYIFRLRKASAPLSAKACLQLYPAVRHAGLLCAAQFYTRNASFINFCACAAFSYLFLFSALLPSAGRLFVFPCRIGLTDPAHCFFYLKHLPVKSDTAA